MNIVILEDELLAAEKLERLVKKMAPNANILASLDSVLGAVEWFTANEQPVHLVFMDIHLADGLCFAIFERIQLPVPIIFTTAFDQYAIQAFRVNSIDYLLKPITQKDLAKSFDKYNSFQSVWEPPEINYTYLAEILRTGQKVYKQRFLVKQGNKFITVPAGQIHAFYAEGRYVFLVTELRKKYIVNFSLDQLEEILDPACFYRVNRQQILHVDAIREMRPYFKGRLQLIVPSLPDVDIVVSSEKSPLFKKWLER
ncbi:MAG: LytTR family DNA-binding domain-containing protein [Bacteroidota bacterium]